MRKHLASAKPISRAERILSLVMLSGVYTALAVSPVGARLAGTFPMLRDPNPTHYVSGFANPFAPQHPTGHFVVTMPR